MGKLESRGYSVVKVAWS